MRWFVCQAKFSPMYSKTCSWQYPQPQSHLLRFRKPPHSETALLLSHNAHSRNGNHPRKNLKTPTGERASRDGRRRWHFSDRRSPSNGVKRRRPHPSCFYFPHVFLRRCVMRPSFFPQHFLRIPYAAFGHFHDLRPGGQSPNPTVHGESSSGKEVYGSRIRREGMYVESRAV